MIRVRSIFLFSFNACNNRKYEDTARTVHLEFAKQIC